MNKQTLLLKIFSKNSKHFQDPTRDLLYPMVTFLHWLRIANQSPLNSCIIKCKRVTHKPPHHYVKIVRKDFFMKSEISFVEKTRQWRSYLILCTVGLRKIRISDYPKIRHKSGLRTLQKVRNSDLKFETLFKFRDVYQMVKFRDILNL